MKLRVFSAIFATVLVLSPLHLFGQGVAAVYDNNGQLVGLWAGSTPGATSSVEIVSLRGFRFRVEGNGRIAGNSTDLSGGGYAPPFLYTTTDCTGPAYLTLSGAPNPAPGGVVTRLRLPSPLFYVAKSTEVLTLTVRAYTEDFGGCILQTNENQRVVPVLPNDPAVTGVPNNDFAPPLRLEVVPLSAVHAIFRDGFESASTSTISALSRVVA